MEVMMFLQIVLAALWFSQNISAVPINRENFGLECEREVSSKGDNYYVLTVFNSKIDMPCPPGTVYNKHLCDCDDAPAGQLVNDDKTTTTRSTTTSQTTQHTSTVPETTSTSTQPLMSNTTKSTTPKTTAKTTTLKTTAKTTTPKTTTKTITPKTTAKTITPRTTAKTTETTQITKTKATTPTTQTTTNEPTTTPTVKSSSTTVAIPNTTPTTTPTTTTTRAKTQTPTSTTQQPTTTTKMTTEVMSTTGSVTTVSVPSTTESTTPACRFKADGNGFIENVPMFGNIYSECATGLVFSAPSCGCVKKGSIVATTTTPVTTKTICPYRRQGTGFMEDVPGIGKVWHSCGKDELFMNSACQCVSKGLVTGTEPTTAEMSTATASSTTTSSTSQSTTAEPARCNNRIKEANGYKEYNNVIMDWVFYECSPSLVFSLRQCDCVDPGTNPIPPSGPPKDCTNFEVKGTGYIEHIANVGAVYNNCPPNMRFSMTACDCTDADGKSHTGGSTNTIRITDSDIVDCGFETQGDGYTENIPGVGDVYYTCVTNHRFIKGLCRCIDKSITIIDETTDNTVLQTSTVNPATSAAGTATETSKSSSTTSSPSTTAGLRCKDRIKSGNGYMEYFESLNDWVFFECSSAQEFNIAECDCVTSGADPSTQGPKTDCTFEARGNGYIENIPGIGAVYSDCPSTQLFYTSLCACAAAGSGKNHDLITITDQNRVQNCAFETRGNGFVEHVIGIGLVYHDCSRSERFVASLCKCIDKDTVIVDNTSPMKTTQPSTTSTAESTTPAADPATSPPSTATVTTPTTTGHEVTNKDCLYEQVPGQNREFRAPMTWMPGQYMYFSCSIGQEFDIVACSCVDEKVTTTQPTINPA
ncbi:mucin-5AC-like [Mizuhopecten yessoensis]|uniref:mucin-5AC-like n=1 Tax=Mizuhopecten yessoensis TaxID=6573 RepID=UPI000B45D5B3|nr:mucin-5AC-like [Mizuhopecten yessoensis]